MAKRWLLWTGIWVVVSALAFLAFYWVVALAVAIMGLVALVVAMMSSDWDQHSTFEERELARARRRAAKQAERRERTKDARAKDRARWEAHQARKAARAAQTER